MSRGSSFLYVLSFWVHISPSGASRHLPINGEEQHYYRSVSAPPALRASSPSMGRSSTTTDLYQPLRRFAPAPHQWGGAALLQICISPSVGLRPTPPHKWGGTAHRKERAGAPQNPGA